MGSFSNVVFYILQHSQMLTGRVTPQTNAPPQGFVFFLVPLLSPGVLRSRALLRAPQLKHSIVPAAELSGLRVLLHDLHIFLPTRPTIWCDNISSISLASNPIFHAQTKHVEVDYHFIREKVLRKGLDARYVSTVDQLTDIFTNGLHPRRFQYLRTKLMVADRPIRLKGRIDK